MHRNVKKSVYSLAVLSLLIGGCNYFNADASEKDEKPQVKILSTSQKLDNSTSDDFVRAVIDDTDISSEVIGKKDLKKISLDKLLKTKVSDDDRDFIETNKIISAINSESDKIIKKILYDNSNIINGETINLGDKFNNNAYLEQVIKSRTLSDAEKKEVKISSSAIQEYEESYLAMDNDSLRNAEYNMKLFTGPNGEDLTRGSDGFHKRYSKGKSYEVKANSDSTYIIPDDVFEIKVESVILHNNKLILNYYVKNVTDIRQQLTYKNDWSVTGALSKNQGFVKGFDFKQDEPSYLNSGEVFYNTAYVDVSDFVISDGFGINHNNISSGLSACVVKVN